MNTNMYQTGDVAYYPLGFPYLENPTVKGIPKEAKRIVGNQIHATPGGNSHGFKGSAGVFELDGAIFIDAEEDITLIHPEHKNVLLPAGQYEVRHVREKDHFSDMVRYVVD